ncbi:FAD dependent oxidoreductase [Amniculicola lignicola CBS 123094]|uniref:FAD dependent oxidoreductase n=1 Tax=Amniculicola lignicola CBS 123094 TaxID=1392246 RepID=A0A6A5X2Z1_9PLEO|nr:FAD dependent oxidoreductase [Amniculicola lignicola CBS 123094]
MAPSESFKVPSSILIVGSGVFGLSTAWSLCKNPLFENTSITLVDRQPFPCPDGSSIDTSRIVRPDYADAAYTSLASSAQALWRTTFAPSFYHENGLCITASGLEQTYVSSSYDNVCALGSCRVQKLKNEEEIKQVCGTERASGTVGYVNWSSGWADAEGSMCWLCKQVEARNRVHFITDTVKKLVIDHSTNTVAGVQLTSNTTLTAALTILAAGAWTPSLLDLRGIAKATGQVLIYLPLTSTEQAHLGSLPTILNLSTGLFAIPPSHNLLKIARHGYGYTNPVTIPHPTSTNSSETITISLPHTHIDNRTQCVPSEGLTSCLSFLSHIHPTLSTRSIQSSRICWYTDTPTGDFLITHHPTFKGLFVATGGSGHAFKFLPVIGDKIVECVMGRTPDEFKGRWEWPEKRVSDEEWVGDGSRGGPVGMVLQEETEKGALERGSKL